MAGRDGFQPCKLGEGVGPAVPQWERTVVLSALLVHVVDVGLDIFVVLLFLCNLEWGFLLGSAGVVLGAGVVSGLYVSFGAGANSQAELNESASEGIRPFCLNFTQLQIFIEAYRCIFQGGETDYFHTLRLLEALLEAAPSSLVQLYALILWAGTGSAPAVAVPLLHLSVLVSFVSVGLGLAMWEQKVQVQASCGYIVGVAALRTFEIASRSITLALFACLTHPFGLWWVLLFDYGIMLFLIARHRSVHLTYGFFVALPLLLVSLEPLVWRRQDHAVPKDAYYSVRVLEFVFMWGLIIRNQDEIDSKKEVAHLWVNAEALALISTVGLYFLLPFVWRAARRQELSRDVDNWGDDSDDQYTDSQGLTGSEEAAGLVEGGDDRDLPPE